MACSNGIFEFADDYYEWWDNINDWAEDTWIGSYFKLKERNSRLSTELRAGAVTFLTTAYILSVNALILSDTGGTCGVDDCTGPDKGLDRCRFVQSGGYRDPGYVQCLTDVKRDLITATAGISLVASFLMGAAANLPVAAAPGMGLNAYFAYNVVGTAGSGQISYQKALAAVFVEGCIFILLAMTGMRLRLIRIIPRSIMLATSAGIGLFLAFIGLQNTEGMAVVAYNGYTLVSLGGCPAQYQVMVVLRLYARVPTMQHDIIFRHKPDPTCCGSPTCCSACPAAVEPAYVIPNNNISAICSNPATPALPRASTTFHCNGHKMESATLWLGLAGLLAIAVMMSRSFRGSVFIGIIFVTVIAWIPGHGASYLGAGSPIPEGQQRLDLFKQVAAAPTLTRIGAKLDFSGFNNGDLWIALLTFLFVDFADTTSTMFSMASFLNNFVPGFVRPDKTFERSWIAFSVDGVSSVVGALLGTSPVTCFIESASGIREGGRTGLTALTVAFFFFVALFFSPLLASVPPYAVGPALITVGALMMMNAVRIKWDQAGEALPAFATIIITPLTYSISYGIIAGIVGYVLVNSVNWLLDKLADLVAKMQDSKVPKTGPSVTERKGLLNGSYNGRPPPPDSSYGADKSYGSRYPTALRHSESRIPLVRRSTRTSNDVGDIYFGRASGRKASMAGSEKDSSDKDSPARRASGINGMRNSMHRQKSAGSEGELNGQPPDTSSHESLQLAASRLQQMFDESGMEPSAWQRRATSTQDLEHIMQSASPHQLSRHLSLGSEAADEASLLNGGSHGPVGSHGSAPFPPQLRPRHSPWNWSPRVSGAPQETIHERDRSSDESSSSAGEASSSSSSSSSGQPKGLFRRSVMWGREVGKGMVRGPGGLGRPSQDGAAPEPPIQAPMQATIQQPAQATPQRQPPRSFLGRVSATSFLDSVGGMIPGSGGEAEQLPDGRGLMTGAAGRQRRHADHSSRRQQRDALREQRRRWVELGELGDLPGALRPRFMELSIADSHEPHQNRALLRSSQSNNGDGGAPREALLREQRRRRLQGLPQTPGGAPRTHHKAHRKHKKHEPAPKPPRESLEVKIARLGSLGGLFRPSVAGQSPKGGSGDAGDGAQLEKLPEELQGWSPAPQRRVSFSQQGLPRYSRGADAQGNSDAAGLHVPPRSPWVASDPDPGTPAAPPQPEQLPPELQGWPPQPPVARQPSSRPSLPQQGQDKAEEASSPNGEQLPPELLGWPPKPVAKQPLSKPSLPSSSSSRSARSAATAPRQGQDGAGEASSPEVEQLPPELQGWPPKPAAKPQRPSRMSSGAPQQAQQARVQAEQAGQASAVAEEPEGEQLPPELLGWPPKPAGRAKPAPAPVQARRPETDKAAPSRAEPDQPAPSTPKAGGVDGDGKDGMPPPALKHDSRPPSEEKERAQVTFQEPQASAHDPDAPSPRPAAAPQPLPQGAPAGSSEPASASHHPPSPPAPPPAQPSLPADQRPQTAAGDRPHKPVQASPRPPGQHAQQEGRPRQDPMARYSQEHSWTLQTGKQESLPSPFVSADLDSFDLPLHPEPGPPHPPTVPESASEPASSLSGPQPGTVHASESPTTLASGPPGGDSTAEAGKTPEQVSAEAAARQQQQPAQPAARAQHGWDFGSFAPKPRNMHRGGHSRSQSRDVEQGRPGSSRDASEAEGQQVSRGHMPQLAPEIGSPAISGFPLGPRGMVPWLARRQDSVPGSSLPQRSMVIWKDCDDTDVQLPR